MIRIKDEHLEIIRPFVKECSASKCDCKQVIYPPFICVSCWHYHNGSGGNRPA